MAIKFLKTKIKFFSLTAILLSIGILGCMAGTPGINPTFFQIESGFKTIPDSVQTSWIVTDEPNPRLSWEPIAEVLGKPVIGYEVIVADNKSFIVKGKGNLWNSKFLHIENGPWVLFDASRLPSCTEVWWRVRPVFSKTAFGEWSDIAHFEIGLKNQEDWKGKWIGMNQDVRRNAAPQFRKTFILSKSIAKARLYVCGLGYHESWLNGSKLGNEVLQPAQTDYDVRSFYVAHDVTSVLRKGTNVLGFWVGDGFFNQNMIWGKNGLSYGDPRVIAQLEVTYTDGTTNRISTDETWQCKASAVTRNNIYAGENYDARIADPNWATENATADGWISAIEMPDLIGKLIAQELPPCRKFELLPVKKISQLKPGTWICDFGQNMVGWAKLSVNASPGTIITIRFAENQLPSGELGFASGGVFATKVIQTDVYTCKGGGIEIWEPRFVYHGFRFAEVTISKGKLLDGTPETNILEGIVIHTDMPVVGEFSCSDETLNDAFKKAHWTQVGNFLGVPTDCPIRERCGWTGDAHNIVPYTMYRFDASASWRKYLNDIVTTAQIQVKKSGTKEINKGSGLPTMVAPGKRTAGSATPDWGSALTFIPWDIYRFTGDIRSLRTHYNSMRFWTEHLHWISKNNIVYEGLGDWCKPYNEGKNREEYRKFYGLIKPMLSTACYYRCAKIMANTAKLLNKQGDSQYFTQLSDSIREAFTKNFYGESPIMVPDQTINAIAVEWDVVDPVHKIEAAKRLNQQVIDANYHFMTGVFGMPSLWPVLVKYGYQETAWKALQVESYPSLKYLTKRGATTFWENWPSEKDENEEYERSMSHPFWGGFVAWFYEGLAGISQDQNVPGFKLIHLEPQLIDGLNWVNCRYTSPMGDIESSWERNESKLVWTVEIPAGATALLRISGKLIEIKGATKKLIAKVVQSDDFQGEAQRIKLSSGKYQITARLR